MRTVNTKKLEDENSSGLTTSSPDTSLLRQVLTDDCLIESDTVNNDEREATVIIPGEEKLSSSHITTGSLSLRYSAVCSSISSMFDQVLDRSPTSISEGQQFDNISQHSDGDLLIVSNDKITSAPFDENCDNDDASIEASPHVVPEEIVLEPGINRHDFSSLAFRKVGERLLEDAHSVYSVRGGEGGSQNGDDCPNFTKEEWECFISAANSILPVLDPSSTVFNALPPSPPQNKEQVNQNEAEELIESEIWQFLPTELVCALCSLPIAGSATLDCGCNKSFCISCIEQANKKLKDKMKGTRSCRCPLCSLDCNYMPCHALDVAILEKIMDLDRISQNRNLEQAKILQANYYARLMLWRTEINRRDSKKDRYRQLLLADYVSCEKKALKQYEKMKKKEKGYERAEGLVFIGACLMFGVRALIRLK